MVARKQPGIPVKTWQPNAEDIRLMDELHRIFGVGHPGILRIALRSLAQANNIPLGEESKAAD